MSRFVHQAISSFTLIGYLLVVTWGPAWHDHDHGHCHSHALGPQIAAAEDAGHSHAHCCSHHHACCDTERSAETAPAPAPCQSPFHDDGCVVCQIFAHPPLAPPAIELVDVGEPVADRAEVPAPASAFQPSPVYDSRGPPAV